ncbi:hypothetical protein SAMN02745127_00144 [Oceanospirillum multiglobuliferum]|uniref:Uncharacterized protein n=2 Tax=Oceanospirillum TaxID=965 RepID=A0A1T4KNN5_9GAMM|nr:hypothetical protein [Oceanospirillum multiglobuliferum]OPX56085.1 hypothetical protein BTE48_05935 [Oceanospirillum multiglobuliferum]SJZ44025.1 hypothetical protein SAMN02745127_00144 [Oceanospirillum multiglobuliferum]
MSVFNKASKIRLKVKQHPVQIAEKTSQEAVMKVASISESDRLLNHFRDVISTSCQRDVDDDRLVDQLNQLQEAHQQLLAKQCLTGPQG